MTVNPKQHTHNIHRRVDESAAVSPKCCGTSHYCSQAVRPHHASPSSVAVATSSPTSTIQAINPHLPFIGWKCSCIPSLSSLLVAIQCGLLTTEHAWSGGLTIFSVTAALSLLGQRCGTVYLNSYGNRTSLSDSSRNHLKSLCLVNRAAAPWDFYI